MNRLQVQLIETDQSNDVLAGVAFVRALPNVDERCVAVVGHSFGGSIALVSGERDRSLRAVVDFSGASASWEPSPELRERLKRAVRRIAMPVLFLHAVNDYSTTPGRVLAARMTRLGKRHRLVIYPACGKSSYEGHNFVDLCVAAWEPDVFAFLDAHLGGGLARSAQFCIMPR